MVRAPLPTEDQMILRLRRGKVAFPPLALTWQEPGEKQRDAVIRMTWLGKTFRFVAECKRYSNPKAVTAAADQARRNAKVAKLLPLAIVPFLDEQALDILESMSVSGIDLCGNGVVIVPGEWYARRTGNPNPFRQEGAIKNVYRKSSSVVARLFLLQREFSSLHDALDELIRRGGRVTRPTVSKVCKRLQEDLIIERKTERLTKLRLLQPEKLLGRLAANYSPPNVTNRVSGKIIGLENSEFRRQLQEWANRSKNRIALTGVSSVGAYAIMARGGMQEFYCTDVPSAVCFLGDHFLPTERFATASFLEAQDEEVYFDRRDDLIASPVQAFLELSAGDKRDQETAAQVRKIILDGISSLDAR